MEVRAIAKSVRISPRKVRLVADAIRNLSIEEALQVLDAAEKRAALPLAKALKSAMANAVNNAKLEKDSLSIASIQIAEGQPLKRFHPSTRGRIHPYKKRSSHITIVLQEKPGFVKAAPAVKVDDKKVKEKEVNKDEKKGKK
jgi:large subunit ribosomal protein L22